jgi:hypothetical protein
VFLATSGKMADAFGDELFNVFNEDSSSSRPVPTLEVGEICEETPDRSKCDDNER